MVHYVDTTELDASYTSFSSSKSPSSGSITINKATSLGQQDMYIIPLPNSCGNVSSCNSCNSTSGCWTEDSISLDELIRSNEQARDYFYSNGDAHSFQDLAYEDSKSSGREQGMKLRVHLRFSNLEEGGLLGLFHSVNDLTGESTGVVSGVDSVEDRKVAYEWDADLVHAQAVRMEMQQLSPTERIRWERFGIHIEFVPSGTLYKYDFSTLQVELMAGLSVAFTLFKLFPMIWIGCNYARVPKP